MIAPFRLLTGGSGKADEITINTMYADAEGPEG